MLVIIRINVNSITTVHDSIVKRTLWLLYPCQKCVFKLFCACSAQCARDTYQAPRNTPWTECKPMHVGSRSSLRQVNSDCSDNGWVHKNSSRRRVNPSPTGQVRVSEVQSPTATSNRRILNCGSLCHITHSASCRCTWQVDLTVGDLSSRRVGVFVRRLGIGTKVCRKL